MDKFRNKVVVITGAGSGIGLETARAFARKGARLALTDIDGSRLEAAKTELTAMGRVVMSQVVDVAERSQVSAFCDGVYERFGRVDVLCNNAGVGWLGKFEDVTLENWERIVGINMWGVIYGCHYFYPRMMSQGGGGHIVNVSSLSGLTPAPMMTAYCCTKYAVMGFTETLRAEAALNGIGVTVVCPGVIKTNITVNAKVFTSTKKSSGDQIAKKMDRYYTKRNYLPDRVAAQIVEAVEKNKGVLLVAPETYYNDLLHKLNRSSYIDRVGKRLQSMLDRM